MKKKFKTLTNSETNRYATGSRVGSGGEGTDGGDQGSASSRMEQKVGSEMGDSGASSPRA